MKRGFITAFAILALLALTACNTMAGAGRDIQKAGEKIEGAARGGR